MSIASDFINDRRANRNFNFFGVQDEEMCNAKESSSYGYPEGAECLVKHYYDIKGFSDVHNQDAIKIDSGLPRKIHFIWLGPNPVPKILFSSESSGDEEKDILINDDWNATMISWRRKHPNWTFKLWKEPDVRELFKEAVDHSVNDDDMCLFQSVHNLYEKFLFGEKNYVMASDLIRWFILYFIGGVYVDIDYYCVNSLSYLNQSFDWYCGASNVNKKLEINNGLLASSPNHYLTRLILEHLVKVNSEDIFLPTSKIVHGLNTNIFSFLDHQSLKAIESSRRDAEFSRILQQTGPIFLTRFLFKYFQNNRNARIDKRICILPFHFFHPLPNKMSIKGIDKEMKESKLLEMLRQQKGTIYDEIFAVHFWACSWQNGS